MVNFGCSWFWHATLVHFVAWSFLVSDSLFFSLSFAVFLMAGGGGGAAPAPKQDENQPHPIKDQLPNIAYCITSPPPWRAFHFFVLGHLLHFIFFFLRKRHWALTYDIFSLFVRKSLQYVLIRFCFLMKLYPAAAEAILLGFQHYIVMLGTTVAIPTYLAPQMGGGNVRHNPYHLNPVTHFQMITVSDCRNWLDLIVLLLIFC